MEPRRRSISRVMLRTSKRSPSSVETRLGLLLCRYRSCATARCFIYWPRGWLGVGTDAALDVLSIDRIFEDSKPRTGVVCVCVCSSSNTFPRVTCVKSKASLPGAILCLVASDTTGGDLPHPLLVCRPYGGFFRTKPGRRLKPERPPRSQVSIAGCRTLADGVQRNVRLSFRRRPHD